MVVKSKTTQKKAEEEVEKFRAELGPFVVAADDTRMPMIFTNARSGGNEIVYVNDSLLELLNYDRSDLVGKPFANILAEDAGRTPFPLGVAAEPHGKSHNVLCVRKDGSEFPAAMLVSPVVGDNGELRQFFVSLVDLTSHIRRRNEDQIRYRDLYKNTPGFIAQTSGSEHRFTYVNAAYVTLVGQRDLVGKPVAEALPETVGTCFLAILDRVYQTGEHFTGRRMPITFQRATGPEVRYVDFVYQPVRNDEGLVTGLFCEGSDVTELHVSSEELAVVQARLVHLSRLSAMGTMAATLAHELNQPLAAIINYAAGCRNYLTDGGIVEGPLQEGLEGIGLAAERAGHVIRQLRSMTKRATLLTETFDIDRALEEAVLLVRAGGCDGVAIHIEQPVRGRVTGDRVQIQQVMINLLKNACEAAVDGKSKHGVTAGSAREKGKIRVSFKDTGPGIPKDAQATLFQWSDSTKTDGMGIGLSISRTIVERHNGTIGLDRTGASGSLFSFLLPESRD